MELEKKVSIGDIIAVGMGVIAILGLVFQARSIAVSEEQLKTEIVDISNLVKEIESQKSTFFNEKIERIIQGTDLSKNQRKMDEIVIGINLSGEKTTNMYLSSLVLSQAALYITMPSFDLEPDQREIMNAAYDLNSKVSKMLAISEEWADEQDKLNNQYTKKLKELELMRPTTSEIVDDMDNLVQKLAQEIATLNGRYLEKTRPLKSEFLAAKYKLDEKIMKLIKAPK